MILVIGCGFVGETVAKSLEKNGHTVGRVDPKLGTTISTFSNFESAIVCLPSPTVNGKCDDALIRSVIDQLNDVPVLLKSTITPDLIASYPDNVSYYPEFLRAASAQEDFDNQHIVILGGEHSQLFYWKHIFSYLNAEVIETDRHTASMVKYMHNVWLAMKVAFFHEIFYLLPECNFFSMASILAKFPNIGPTHMFAPNDTNTLGFGGHCFPKDTEAFQSFSNSEILKKVIEVNNMLGDKGCCC